MFNLDEPLSLYKKLVVCIHNGLKKIISLPYFIIAVQNFSYLYSLQIRKASRV